MVLVRISWCCINTIYGPPTGSLLTVRNHDGRAKTWKGLLILWESEFMVGQGGSTKIDCPYCHFMLMAIISIQRWWFIWILYWLLIMFVICPRFLQKPKSGPRDQPWNNGGLPIYGILAEFILPAHCCHFMLLGQILCVVQSILWLQANDDLYVWSILSILCLWFVL